MHAHVLRLVSVVNMATVLEGVLPTSRVLLYVLLAKGLNANDIHKEMFLFTVGSCVSVNSSQLGGKRFIDDDGVEMEVRKWLRQQ
jgi:hypothetical protein